VPIISIGEWRKLPIGPDAPRWSTRPPSAAVLVAVLVAVVVDSTDPLMPPTH